MFTRAVRSKVFLKIGIMGPSGAGKTFSGIQLASGLSQGKPFAAIDTENGSMSLYADQAPFDVMDVAPPFHPKKVVEAIKGAADVGYEVLLIDSQTHFWKWVLDTKTAIDASGGNQYTNWAKVKPHYESLKEAILQSPLHIVACMRGKDEYVLENDGKKSAPRKVGMGAIAEPGAEYEYTTMFDVGMDHQASVSKDRTGMFDAEIFKIEKATGQRFLDWLAKGADLKPVVVELDPRKILADWTPTEDQKREIKEACIKRGLLLGPTIVAAHEASVGAYDFEDAVSEFFAWLEVTHPLHEDDGEPDWGDGDAA